MINADRYFSNKTMWAKLTKGGWMVMEGKDTGWYKSWNAVDKKNRLKAKVMAHQ